MARSLIIWDVLLLETSPERGFLRDCAQLAFHVAPSPEAARSLVSRVNEADALAVAFSCALLANAGLGPKETAETAKLFHKLSAAMRGQARAQLEMTSFWRKDKASRALLGPSAISCRAATGSFSCTCLDSAMPGYHRGSSQHRRDECSIMQLLALAASSSGRFTGTNSVCTGTRQASFHIKHPGVTV